MKKKWCDHFEFVCERWKQWISLWVRVYVWESYSSRWSVVLSLYSIMGWTFLTILSTCIIPPTDPLKKPPLSIGTMQPLTLIYDWYTEYDDSVLYTCTSTHLCKLDGHRNQTVESIDFIFHSIFVVVVLISHREDTFTKEARENPLHSIDLYPLHPFAGLFILWFTFYFIHSFFLLLNCCYFGTQTYTQKTQVFVEAYSFIFS